MEIIIGVWLALFLGSLPLLWWWNRLWYVTPFKVRQTTTGSTLPPGHMGLPFFGEMLNFLWYFKILRCPDDFINAKRRK